MDQARLSELIALTRQLFAAVPRPLITKRIGRAADDEWFPTQERCDELAAQDKEQHWWEVSDNELEEFADVLPWLPSEGFRFYFPAFLSYSLRRWNCEHDRVHLETLETIGLYPKLLESLSVAELSFVNETIVELACDPRGSHYETFGTTVAIDNRLRRLSQPK